MSGQQSGQYAHAHSCCESKMAAEEEEDEIWESWEDVAESGVR